MKWTTSCARAASNAASGNGSAPRMPLHVDARIARASGRDEWLGGIDRRDGIRAQPRDQLGGECAGPAADVDHALAAAHPGEVRQLRREQDASTGP